MWVLTTVLGCSTIHSPDTPPCDPRTLNNDEVRIRPILCGDEEISSGDGRRGDFILENNQIRLTLRPPGTSLSQLNGYGATIVDIVPVSEQEQGDAVAEMWLSQTDMKPMPIVGWSIRENGVILYIPDGEVKLWLEPDDPTIYTTPHSWTIRPTLETEVYGSQLHSPDYSHEYILDFDATGLDDVGGDILLTELQTITVHSTSNTGSVEIPVPDTLHDDFDWIDLYTNDNTYIGRVWTRDVDDLLRISPSTEFIKVGRNGCQSRPQQSIQSDLDWSALTCGSLGIRLYDGVTELAGAVNINNRIHYIPETGFIIPLIDNESTITVWSSLSHEPEQIDLRYFNLDEHPRLNIYLPNRFTEAAALHTILNTAPTITERSIHHHLFQSIGLGSTHQLLASQDNILRLVPDPSIDRLIDTSTLQIGLLSNQTVLSWPWSPSLRAGLGALNPNLMTENDLLTQATAQNRLVASSNTSMTESNSVTDPSWTQPDFTWLQEPSIVEMRNICQWSHPRPLGRWTWLDQENSDVNHSLLELEYSTGNGPYLILQPVFFTERIHQLELTIHSTDWMNLEYWELWSNEGLENSGTIDTHSFTLTQSHRAKERWCLLTWGTTNVHPFNESTSWAVRILEAHH